MMRRSDWSARAVTLIELLVAMGVIALLAAILMPALGASRDAARDLECRSKLRAVSQSFIEFADDSGVGRRGDSENLGGDRFRIEDFQESVYGVDEYWNGPPAQRVALMAKEQPLVCPAGPTKLERRAGIPCSAGAIGPQANVSVGFNKRLDQRTRFILSRPFPSPAYLTSTILHYPDVPLVFDVDGKVATERDQLPYYAAPPIMTDKQVDIYEDGAAWFPSLRHRGRLNVGFVGGHVLSSTQPTGEPWWRWDFQPES